MVNICNVCVFRKIIFRNKLDLFKATGYLMGIYFLTSFIFEGNRFRPCSQILDKGRSIYGCQTRIVK